MALRVSVSEEGTFNLIKKFKQVNNSYLQTLPSIRIRKKFKKSYEFVGPICESTDKFSTLNKFQEIKEKDLIVICDVGAYGMSLSSNYNMRPKPPELLINGSKIKVIRKRQKHKDFL